MNFPLFRSYLDHAGNARLFAINRLQNPAWPGCILSAQEIEDIEDNKLSGYYFEAAVDADNQVAALSALHKKIQTGLSTRHLYIKNNEVTMLSDTIKGTIGCPGLTVDGEKVSYDQLIELLAMHEGFNFELKITDSCNP